MQQLSNFNRNQANPCKPTTQTDEWMTTQVVQVCVCACAVETPIQYRHAMHDRLIVGTLATSIGGVANVLRVAIPKSAMPYNMKVKARFFVQQHLQRPRCASRTLASEHSPQCLGWQWYLVRWPTLSRRHMHRNKCHFGNGGAFCGWCQVAASHHKRSSAKTARSESFNK